MKCKNGDVLFDGDVTKATQLHQQLLPKMKALFNAPSPVPVKTALNQAGVSVGSVRLPLVPLTSEEEKQLKEALQ